VPDGLLTNHLDEDLAGRLRTSGLRVTASRMAVLEAVTHSPHSDADTIAVSARRRLGSLSTQAVYNNLYALGRAGLLRRIEPAGGPARYEARVGDNHHHIVCRSCATTCDVDCAVGIAPCLEASDTHGFLVDEAEVTFWGICPTCQPPPGHHERTRP
jgi:Fur family ferric uptake transcriptional regulator